MNICVFDEAFWIELRAIPQDDLFRIIYFKVVFAPGSTCVVPSRIKVLKLG